jgi:bacillolysin
VCTVNTPGIGQTRYSGTRNIITDQPTGVNNFRLFENRNGTDIHVRNMVNEANFQNLRSATEFWDNDNNWTFAEHRNDNVALDIHWAMENILDYWRIERGRNSFDNRNKRVLCYAHVNFPFDIGQNNAVWLGGNLNVLEFADGGTWNPVVSLDVCGHEFGHGINQFTSELPGTNTEGGH